jgi:hypothetical protein
MKSGFVRGCLTMMRAGAQATRMRRRFLRCDYERRKKTSIDCGEREMGSEPAHMFPEMLAGLESGL